MEIIIIISNIKIIINLPQRMSKHCLLLRKQQQAQLRIENATTAKTEEPTPKQNEQKYEVESPPKQPQQRQDVDDHNKTNS